MPINPETLKVLQEFEKESGYGFENLPEGVYHLEVEGYSVNESGEPRLRLQYRVQCGDHERRIQSDFFGAFGKPSDTKTQEQADLGAHKAFYGRLVRLHAAIGENAPSIALDARLINKIDRANGGFEEARRLMTKIGEAATGYSFYADVREREAPKDGPNAGKKFVTINYLDSASDQATCGCRFKGRV